jgi:ribonuclease HI/exonuclease III
MTCFSKPHSIFPTFSITTWNINGMHINNPYDLSHRVRILIDNIKSVLYRSDFLLLQETHTTDLHNLRILLPNYQIFASGLSASKAGVITIANRNISQQYDLSSTPINDSVAQGYILAVYATPKATNLTNDDYSNSLILNCYLHSGDKHKQLAQLKSINKITPANFNFAAGDWNFIDNSKDATPYKVKYRKLSEDFSTEWSSFIVNFGLSEFHQPAHTRFSVTGVSSSRIDRIYGTFSDADRAALTPICYTMSLPHSIKEAIIASADYNSLSGALSNDSAESPNFTHPTDHLPVFLSFRPNRCDPSPSNYYPADLVYSTSFRTAFLQLFSRSKSSAKYQNNPNQELALFKLATRQAMAATKKNSNNSNQDSVVLAIRTLRAINNNNLILANTLVSQDSTLTHVIDNDDINIGKLKSFIVNHRSNDKPQPPDSSDKDLLSKKFKVNYLEQLSQSLPNDKLRFHSLRKNVDSPPTDDPEEMSNIASEFWSPNWSWDAYDHLSASKLLKPSILGNGFDRTITKDVDQVDVVYVTEVILESGDTACGPDGIPFSVYKALCDIAAPILNNVYHHAATGNLPSKNANHSLLYLIPKTPSDLISDSRPINVGNTDVRLLGAIIRKSIYASIEAIISARQKGFLDGRNILNNIKLINEKLHKACKDKKDYDLISIDFMKAFDSLNHTFLICLLEHIKLPRSSINAIQFLIHDLQALTTFKGTSPRNIKLEKGVKQGCPLSPLLFALIMEVLDNALLLPPKNDINKIHPDIDGALFADDACYASPNLAKHIPHFHRTITLFGKATGLRIHIKKSTIVKARMTSRTTKSITTALTNCGWKDITVSPHFKWLGTIIGSKINTKKIFNNALTKFKDRINHYLPLKKHYSLPNRIMIANVFLLTIFSYLYQIYFIPGDYLKTINSLLYKWLVSFNSFSLADLSRPTNRCGLSNTLKDIRIVNIAALIATAPSDLTPTSYKGRIHNSGRITDHQKHALALFHAASPNSSILTKRCVKIRSKVYSAIINSGKQQMLDIKRIRGKLTRYNIEHHTQNLSNNYNTIHHKTPNFVRLTFLKIIHNAFPTARRMRHMDSHIQPGTTCPFGCAAIDSIEHLFGDCKHTWRNVNAVRQTFSLPPIPAIQRNLATILGAAELLSRLEATLNIFLIFVIWHARSELLNGNNIDVPYYFSSKSLKLIGKYCPVILKMAALTSAHSTITSNPSSVGKSGKRTKDQIAAAKAAAQLIISSLPSNSIVAYTDGGTHNSNPGPCGSGIHIPRHPPKTPLNLSVPLGWGTNNLGEIVAIGAAIHLTLLSKPHPGTEIHILTDSFLSYGILELHWKAKTYPLLTRTIRRMIALSHNSTPIKIHWIAGHADIEGNDAADAVATLAAKNSSSDPPDLSPIISNWTKLINDLTTLL